MARPPKTPQSKPTADGLPTKEQILEYLSSAQGKAGKREISRAFGVKGGARIALKRLLAEMADDGALSGNRKSLREKGKLPNVSTLDVTGRDRDGDLVAKPIEWDDTEGKRPAIRLLPSERPLDGEIGIGDKILARVTKLSSKSLPSNSGGQMAPP